MYIYYTGIGKFCVSAKLLINDVIETRKEKKKHKVVGF